MCGMRNDLIVRFEKQQEIVIQSIMKCSDESIYKWIEF